MKHLLNLGHIQFDLLLGGVPQQLVGKMVKADDIGCSIVSERDGVEHYYTWKVIEHAVAAP